MTIQSSELPRIQSISATQWQTWQADNRAPSFVTDPQTKTVIVDVRPAQQMEEVFAIFAERLDFIEDFGGNLDALYDSLTDWMMAANDEGQSCALVLVSNQTQAHLQALLGVIDDAILEFGAPLVQAVWVDCSGL